MEAIILAGGLGTRLRHLVPDVPKPMAPVAGRPFLEFVLSFLAMKNFDRIVMSVGFMAEKITSYFGTSFGGTELVYNIETTPLGTGGAIRQSFSRCREDHVYVINGDTYLDLEVAEVEARWRKRHLPIIVTSPVADTARYGRVVISGDRVVAISKKRKKGPGLVNAGCYVLPVDVLESFESCGKFSLENDFFPVRLSSCRFENFTTKGYFIDIGVPDDYVRAQSELPGIVR